MYIFLEENKLLKKITLLPYRLFVLVTISFILTSTMSETEKQKLSSTEIEGGKKKRLHQKALREARQFKKEFAQRALKLVTSGFGLVSALA